MNTWIEIVNKINCCKEKQIGYSKYLKDLKKIVNSVNILDRAQIFYILMVEDSNKQLINIWNCYNEVCNILTGSIIEKEEYNYYIEIFEESFIRIVEYENISDNTKYFIFKEIICIDSDFNDDTGENIHNDRIDSIVMKLKFNTKYFILGNLEVNEKVINLNEYTLNNIKSEIGEINISKIKKIMSRGGNITFNHFIKKFGFNNYSILAWNMVNDIHKLEIFIKIFCCHYEKRPSHLLDIINLSKKRFQCNNNELSEEYINVFYFLLVVDDENFNENLIEFRNILTSRKKISEDLSFIALLCYKLEKYERLGIIIDNANLCENILNPTGNLIINEISTDLSKISNYFSINNIDIEELTEFYYRNKRYCRITELYKLHKNKFNNCLDMVFSSMIKLGDIKEADILFAEICCKKYDVNCDENLILNRTTMFEYQIVKNHIIDATNTLKEIKNQKEYIKCLTILYQMEFSELIVTAVNIAIDNLGTRNCDFLQVLISFIHLENVKISAEERLKIVINAIKKQDFSEDQKDWLYAVIYNNLVDIKNRKLDIVILALRKLRFLRILDLDQIYLNLVLLREQTKNVSSEIEMLFEHFKAIVFIGKNEGSYTDVFAISEENENIVDLTQKVLILFYEFYIIKGERNRVREISEYVILRQLISSNFIYLLNISVKNDPKRDIIIEADRRKCLNPNIFENSVKTMSKKGPMALRVYLESLHSIDVRKYINYNSKAIFLTQIEICEAIGNTKTARFFNRLSNNEVN